VSGLTAMITQSKTKNNRSLESFAQRNLWYPTQVGLRDGNVWLALFWIVPWQRLRDQRGRRSGFGKDQLGELAHRKLVGIAQIYGTGEGRWAVHQPQ
jgi:hypothetical protein